MLKAITASECEVSAANIARHVKGQLFGQKDRRVSALAPLDEGHQAALSFANDRGLKDLLRRATPDSKSTLSPFPGIVLCSLPSQGLTLELDRLTESTSLIVVEHPQRAFIACIPLFYRTIETGCEISSRADIHPSAIIGSNVSIGAFCSIGADCIIEDNVTIFPNCILYPGVKIGSETIIHASSVIREGVELGSHCVIQPGAVVGADGFGYIPDPATGLLAIPQVGRVILGDNVDVGANSCIDRGAVGDTHIGNGTKVDNLVQIGHNVKVGAYTIICGSSAIGGSSIIGSQCILGGRTGVADHVSIPTKTTIAGNSGVDRTITEPGVYRGFPIEKDIPWRRQQASLRSLPVFMRNIKRRS